MSGRVREKRSLRPHLTWSHQHQELCDEKRVGATAITSAITWERHPETAWATWSTPPPQAAIPELRGQQCLFESPGDT